MMKREIVKLNKSSDKWSWGWGPKYGVGSMVYVKEYTGTLQEIFDKSKIERGTDDFEIFERSIWFHDDKKVIFDNGAEEPLFIDGVMEELQDVWFVIYEE